MILIYPKCERLPDATGAPQGSSITCSCGERVAVPKPSMSRKTRKILTAVVLAFLCIGLPVIAIPNLINFGARARQAGCYNNLKAIYTVLKMSDHVAPGSELPFSQLRFTPERANRYRYFLGAGPMEDRSRPYAQGSENARAIGADIFKLQHLRVYALKDLPRDVATQIGVTGTGRNRDFVVACAEDIDNKPGDAPDVWSIASRARTIDVERVEEVGSICLGGFASALRRVRFPPPPSLAVQVSNAHRLGMSGASI